MNTTEEEPPRSQQTEVIADPAHRQHSRSHWRAIGFTLRMLEVRLRFVVLLIGLGLLIGYWNTLQNYWDRWTRPAMASVSNVDGDTEFYCPMDPGVVRSGLDPNGSIPKCPICGMPLSQRKKGEPMKLPPGIVGRVSLSPARVRMAGIRTGEVAVRPMVREIRTVGSIAYNESAQAQIVSRVSGYVETLVVDQTFAQVRQGDPLAQIYSPELAAALQELAVAQGVGGNLAEIARNKIRLLGVDDREIDTLLSDPDSWYRVTVRSPTSGIVIKKSVLPSASVTTGQVLFEVADVATLWIEADVFERDLALIQQGQAIEATVEAYPDRKFSGTVSVIYPELQAATRTNRVRFEIKNDESLLHVGMYATVHLTTPLQDTEPFRSILAKYSAPSANPEMAIAQQAVCPVTGIKLGTMGAPIPVDADGQTIYLCCADCRSAVEAKPEYYLGRIHSVTKTGVLSVPESAVIDTGDQKIVYLQKDDGVYEGVAVKLGGKVNGFYSVISGLLPGDRVAAAGAFLIDAETRLNPAASAAYLGASGGRSSDDGSNATSSDQISPRATPESGEPPRQLPPGAASDAADSTLTEQVRPAEDNKLSASPRLFSAGELANLAKLNADDQALAKWQVICPVSELTLGSMGVPLRIVIDGESIMICCEKCQETAQRNARKSWRRPNG